MSSHHRPYGAAKMADDISPKQVRPSWAGKQGPSKQPQRSLTQVSLVSDPAIMNSGRLQSLTCRNSKGNKKIAFGQSFSAALTQTTRHGLMRSLRCGAATRVRAIAPNRRGNHDRDRPLCGEGNGKSRLLPQQAQWRGLPRSQLGPNIAYRTTAVAAIRVMASKMSVRSMFHQLTMETHVPPFNGQSRICLTDARQKYLQPRSPRP